MAFSGGPDSTALLDLLLSRARGRDLEVLAAHFDHALRPGARGEAERAADRARQAGVRVRVGRRESGPDDPGHDELRRRRYRFLRRVGREEEADRIATGHHADDQAETVLFRLLRGTGLRGLRGIPERRGKVVRPLLPFRAEELLRHLAARGLEWSRDPANTDPSYARPRIRHTLLPALERTWESHPVDRLLRVARAAGRAEERMAGLTGRVSEICRMPSDDPFRVPELTADEREEHRVRLSRRPLLRAGRELQARVLRRAARSSDVRMTRGGTAEAVEFINAGRSGGRLHLGGGLELWREFDTVWVGPGEPDVDDRPLPVDASAPGSGHARVGARTYEAAWGPAVEDEPWVHSLAMPREMRQLSLCLRGWRDGDRISVAGTRVKLKELFNRRRVPRSERPRLPLLVAGESDVLWIPGIEAGAAGDGTDGSEEEWSIGVRR